MDIKVPYKSFGQTIAYFPELPAIRYYSKPSMHSNSPSSIDECKLTSSKGGEEAVDAIINPKQLTARSNNANRRSKRDVIKVRSFRPHKF